MRCIERSAIDVTRIATLSLVLDGMTDPAKRKQVQRLGSQGGCLLELFAVVNMGLFAEPNQADTAAPALVAAIVQGLTAGHVPFGGVVEGHPSRIPRLSALSDSAHQHSVMAVVRAIGCFSVVRYNISTFGIA
jgi:hypothetical protein